MDPITTALVGALANISKDAVKDGYDALKGALQKRFGDKRDLIDAVDKLEQKPDSPARQAIVQEEMETAKINDDPDLVRLAQELLKQLNTEKVAAVEYTNEVKGDMKIGIQGGVSGGNINQQF